MFDATKSIKPVMFDGLNAIFDEKGSMYLALRRVQWCSEDAQPDREKSKLELRKWRTTPEGEERADKGFSFLTDNGPHELTHVLVRQGFGNTKETLKALKEREDFPDAVENLFKKDEKAKSSSGEFFDIRTALLADDPFGEDGDDNDEE